jgi:transposase
MAGVHEFAKDHCGRSVVIEVGTHSRWMEQILTKHGLKVTVANPRQLDLITKNKRKNDRNDAYLLARLALISSDSLGFEILKPVEHRSDELQADLMILKARGKLVDARSQFVNMIRGDMKSFGHRLRTCSTESFHKLKSEIPPQLLPALGPIFDSIEVLNTQIRGYDKTINKLQEEHHPDLNVMTEIKGVACLTALAVGLTLANAERFKKSRDAAAYLGLCPAMHESGNQRRDLGISKCGDPFVRKLLVQAAHYIIGPFGEDCDLRRWGLKLKNRGGTANTKRAAVAVARKLATVLHRLWANQEKYEPFRSSPSQVA